MRVVAYSRVDDAAGPGGGSGPGARAEGKAAADSRVDELLVVETWSVTYEHQELLIGRLTAFVDACWHEKPGFRGARVFRSLDGVAVLVQSAWASRAAWEAVRADSRVDAARQVLERFAVCDSRLYELAGERPRPARRPE